SENGSVGAYGSQAIAQTQLQNGHHVWVQKRFATRKVIILDAQPHRLLQDAMDSSQVKKTEAAVVRAAADETVPAFEITKRTGYLKPQIIQVRKWDDRGRDIQYRQWHAHVFTPAGR